MSRLKKMAVAAAVVLAFSAAIAAQAGMLNRDVIVAKGTPNKGAGPIGTPGSDKTIKAHVLALEIAVAALQTTVATQGAQITALQIRFSNLSSHVAASVNLQPKFSNLSSTVSAISSNNALLLGPFVTVNNDAVSADGLNGPNILFNGANIHIVSGSGATATINGLGNLIIGYDELPAVTARGGSHNLVVGPGHNFSSSGGFVAGSGNTVSGADASVSGGQDNTASGPASSVSGGQNNTASGTASSVSGGSGVAEGTADGWSAGGAFHNP